jgi:hypothetical protein
MFTLQVPAITSTKTYVLSILHIYSSRPFQRAIVELIKRQGSKVINRTTDDKMRCKAVFLKKITKTNQRIQQ